MSERRFLVEPAALRAGLVELPPEEADHARKVLRLRPGDEVWLIDGAGGRARAEIATLGKAGVSCRVLAREQAAPPRPRLVLCPGLAKGPAMDLMAVKLTELAVDEVRPFVSARSVPRLDQPGRRVERWQRLAGQALKQCGAAWAPRIAPPVDLAELLASAPARAARIMLYEEERAAFLAQALPALAAAAEIWALVGPEGGFAPEEVAQAREAGFQVLGLGPVILRAETAALALAGVLRLGLPSDRNKVEP
jgi:16S rRNA (uracil1498-N3)-methyltransferase